jgi:hypothetical protein
MFDKETKVKYVGQFLVQASSIIIYKILSVISDMELVKGTQIRPLHYMFILMTCAAYA